MNTVLLVQSRYGEEKNELGQYIYFGTGKVLDMEDADVLR